MSKCLYCNHDGGRWHYIGGVCWKRPEHWFALATIIAVAAIVAGICCCSGCAELDHDRMVKEDDMQRREIIDLWQAVRDMRRDLGYCRAATQSMVEP